MTYPSGVQLSTLTFNSPLTYLGNPVSRTEITVQVSAGVVWAATGDPINDAATTVALGPGVPGAVTFPAVNQPGFTDQAGTATTMWSYIVTRKLFFGSASQSTQKNWQPLTGQATVDFDNLPGQDGGGPTFPPAFPVTSVAGQAGVVDAAALAGALVPFIQVPDANLPATSNAAAVAGKVGKGDLFINVTDAPYSSDPTGTVDATAAIIAAEAAAVAAGRPLLIPAGTYKTSGTIQIRCSVAADEATLNYTGIGTALIVGDKSASAIVTQRRRFLLPKIANAGRGGVAWGVDTVGIELVNLNTCTVHLPQVRDFAIGVKMLGYGAGCAYNVVHLGSLNDNKVGIKLTQDETGYCNQNMVLGGRIEQNPVNGAVVDDINSTYIWFDSNSGTISGANNNTFINTSIEVSSSLPNNAGYYRVIFAGRYNMLINCRWETKAGQTPRVLHKATANSNEINGGYDAWKIVEVVDAGGSPGIIRDGVNGFYRQTNTAGQVIPTAVNTNITTWPNTGLTRIAYDGAGNFTPRAGTWRIRARAAFANNATGVRKLFLSAAGSTQDIHEAPAAATTQTMQVYATVKFNGTQTFSVAAYQNSGADLALLSGSPYVKLEAEWLGY